MAYDLEEQEKLDALRAWWDRYGTLLVILAFVIVAGVLGWRGWQWHQSNQANQAMGYFEALQTATHENGDDAVARIKAASGTLRSDFSKSAYTSRGVLLAAQALHARGDLDGSKEQLEWLVQQDTDPALTPLARLRLAAVLLEQKNYDQANALLSNPPEGYAGLFSDRRGDILLAQGKRAEARKAWEAALSELGNIDMSVRQVLQLKIDALGEV
jgi:predicted negative regulator of RcsB-dependent stress response